MARYALLRWQKCVCAFERLSVANGCGEEQRRCRPTARPSVWVSLRKKSLENVGLDKQREKEKEKEREK